MNPLTKDFLKIVIIMCIMVIIAVIASSCGPHYTTEQVFVPNDSIIHKDSKQIAFFLDGRITTRNMQHVNVIDDKIGVIITKQVRR